jgi:cytochrome c biogenesis protein CcdA
MFQEMKHTLYRFPVGVAMSIFLCGIIWLSIGNILNDEVLLSSLALSGIVTFFLSVGITIWSENNEEKKYI